MCHYITAICSSNTELTDINSVAEEYGFRFDYCENEKVTNQLMNNEKYLLKITKFCECGTSLGIANFKSDKSERIEKSEIDKLIKKGWTETKISRFLVDKKKKEAKITKRNEEILNRGSTELENYINFIQDILKVTNTEMFGFLLHWYSGRIDSENIKIQDRKNISCKRLTTLDLKTLEEDVLLCVTK